jgi:hypothetical protein
VTAGSTKGIGVSAVKWVLITVSIVGAAGALGGTLLRANWKSLRRSMRRRA